MTTRTVRMPVLVSVERLDYQQVITVNLHDVSIVDWCINLCLLKEEVISALRVIGNKKLTLLIDQRLKVSDRAKVVVSTEALEILFHPEEFDALLTFFLKYYRDGVAEVDHVDIEARGTSDLPKDVEEAYLTFLVRDAAPPLSPAAVRKLLDELE